MDRKIIDRLEEASIPEPNSGCWLWTGPVSDCGYGRIWVEGKARRAHRVAFQAYNGIDPGLLFVCHRCDTPACINPAHLWLGTNYENAHDAVRKGRMATGERHPKAKITEAIVREIILSQETRAKTAARLGLSWNIVSGVRRGHRYKQVSLKYLGAASEAPK